MKYKIGDKVRIHNCEGDPIFNGKIGTVTETGRIQSTGHTHWDYMCKFDNLHNYPFGPMEMEKILIKGEQLLFSFMEE